jgi:hypothetical protein
MTWTRIKRWVGTHPVLTLSLVNGGIPCLSAGAMLAQLVLGYFGTPRTFLVFLLMAALALPPAAIGLTCLVGCIRGRAGLTIIDVRNRVVLWVWGVGAAILLIPAVLFVLVNFASNQAPSPNGIHRAMEVVVGVVVGAFGAAVGGLVLTIPCAITMMLGLRLAEEITSRQIACGKWETTVPIEGPGDRHDLDAKG